MSNSHSKFKQLWNENENRRLYCSKYGHDFTASEVVGLNRTQERIVVASVSFSVVHWVGFAQLIHGLYNFNLLMLFGTMTGEYASALVLSILRQYFLYSLMGMVGFILGWIIIFNRRFRSRWFVATIIVSTLIWCGGVWSMFVTIDSYIR